ncbi:hypothetical protein DU508_03235 [Pedobacter chinensis]|uniref:Helix-turn-helix domain-containing protein n=1 Tax=Pedobacter chinensis TaxID=2282421 RepID=A0A369Q4X4_9SPHI|nr:hypothetical protein [Pedobacter chinensis]RDC57979.1 hypothetical protein DU508_03235 [Pedobacter chinensis]
MKVSYTLGQVLEKFVRNDPRGVSGIAQQLKISRRTLYNWFLKDDLTQSQLDQLQVGLGVRLCTKRNGAMPSIKNVRQLKTLNKTFVVNDSVIIWKQKYIDLLEKYNYYLLNKSFK